MNQKKEKESRDYERELHEYKKEMYAHYLTQREQLADQAFKTTERHDQWILTLSGGALAISLTLLEKIVTHPKPGTVNLLIFSWGFLIISLIFAFLAIRTSREALYRARDICREEYQHFLNTSNVSHPAGDKLKEPKNKFSFILGILNTVSASGLVVGIFLLCFFAFGNLNGVEMQKTDISGNVNTNITGTTSNTVLFPSRGISSATNNNNVKP